jgi:Carboxypeptidase regulatory-like domain
MCSIRLRSNRHLRIFTFWLVGLVCVLGLSNRPLRAQQASGSVVGTITDNANAVVPNATVTLTNADTADQRKAVTNGGGDYQFIDLVPGNYKVDVSVSGFKHFTRLNVVVQVQGSTRVDAALQVGDVSQTVEVSAAAPLLETQQATVGQVVAGRSVTELPLNGRNVLNLLELSAGVVPQGSTQAANAVAGMQGNSFPEYAISGGQPNTGAEFIDGAPLNNGYINALSYEPAQDSIQEFRIEGNNIGPEFGGTTDGIVTMVTKSGTNSLHGTVYDYLRNTVLNANTFFSDRAHLARPAFIQNQFGATLGGPIKKDKIFFFGSYQGIRASIGATNTYTVPTAAEEQGVISSSTPITDPGQFNSNGVFVPSAPGTTFPGNIIPANRINPTSRAMFPWWAAPNQPGTLNNYIVNVTTQPTLDQYILRLDWNVSQKQRIFGRYTYHNAKSPSALPYGYLDNPSLSRNAVNQFVLGDSYTLSPTSILDFRLSYLRSSGFSGNTDVPADIGFTGWPAATIAQLGEHCCSPVIPNVSVSGLSGNGGGGQQIFITEENYAISGSETKILGRHTIRFGGEFRRAPNNYGQTVGANTEAFGFTTAFTGNPFASYLLGLPQTTETELALIPASMTYYAGAYIGDTFQATNRLALDFGIRWEFPGYWTERHDRQTVFLPNETSPLAGPTGLPLLGNVELVNTPAYPHRTNILPHYDLFSPRLGVAYRATNNLVVRSGFAILYPETANLQQSSQPYNSAINTAITILNATSQPVNSFSNPFPGGILQPVGRASNYQSVIEGQSVLVNQPKEPATYVEQWNLDIQQDLGHETLLEVAYVGDHGVHQQLAATSYAAGLDQIPNQYDSMGSALLNAVPNPFYGLIPTGNLAGPTIPAGQLLRPYPQYYNVLNAADVAGSSNYNALQAKLEKRFSQGGTVLLSYTWGKNMGTAETQHGSTEAHAPGFVQNWYNIPAEYSQLSYNLPQHFVAGYVYDLPVGKGKRLLGDESGIVDKLVSGWGVDGISTYALGFPLIFTAQPTYLEQDFGAGTPRPNVVTGCAKGVSGGAASKLNGWFNTSCFTQPSNYGFGNEPRVDSMRSQGIANWDSALFKRTAVTERINLEFRAEIFNLFNRVQFGQPNTTCCMASNSSFGVISSQLNSPRQIQFAMKLSY